MTAGKGGEFYVPYENRTGCESIVYFTRDLSAAGLQKIYKKVSGVLHGKVAIKLHTGEQHGPNIIPRPWVKNLFEKEMGIFDDATIIARMSSERRRFPSKTASGSRRCLSANPFRLMILSSR